MWNTLRKNIVFKYCTAVVAVGLIAYFALVPLLISKAFPQYAITKKYVSIEVCTDLAPGTPSKVFLPVSCASLGALSKIGCVYDSAKYIAPENATTDEKVVCPTLVSAIDATGARNPALAALPMRETALQNILTLLFMAIVATVYVAFRLIRRHIKKQKSSVANQNTAKS